jgi:hypothetical protein
LEDFVRPLRDEISAIKFWLARVAITHLKHAELPSEDLSVDVSGLVGPHVEPPRELSSVSNMGELFDSCSPVWHSPTPAILPSLVEASASTNFLVHEETCAISADSFTSEKTKEKAITVPLDTPTVRGDVARCCHPY